MEKKINIELILEGCLQGNRGSQERLYKYFHPYSMSICLRYSKNRQDAREILNEGFLKVFNKLQRYDKNQDFHPWIRKILINTAIDYYRTKQRRSFFLPLENATDIVDDQNWDNFTLEENCNVLPILQELSPAYRIVFNLYVMEGYKHREIAKELDISVNTSKTNLARAKNRLRQLLESKPQLKMKLNEKR